MKTRLSGSSNDATRGEANLVLRVRNEGYFAGLELRKVYQVLADDQASNLHQLRVSVALTSFQKITGRGVYLSSTRREQTKKHRWLR